MNEVEGKDMCNIAAYAGNRQAAPILLEMLRRQQDYDGGMSAGIATVHEGKLYWRKVVGSVETLMQETDALSLPGTIGIAHPRPAGTEQTYHYAHPPISMDGETAVVLNGTAPVDQYAAQRADVIRMLDENGYLFKTALEGSSNGWPVLKNGKYVIGSAETRVHLVDYYLKQGKSCSEDTCYRKWRCDRTSGGGTYAERDWVRRDSDRKSCKRKSVDFQKCNSLSGYR